MTRNESGASDSEADRVVNAYQRCDGWLLFESSENENENETAWIAADPTSLVDLKEGR